MKNNKSQNYLERIPVKNPKIGWKKDDKGIIVLELENKGFFNRIAQVLFKKPKLSYVHLDQKGSMIWQLLDGRKNITEIGKEVDAASPKAFEPLYERLAQFIKTLESYGFIEFKE